MGAPIVHFEIGCKDLEKTRKFYCDLLGWGSEGYGPTTQMISTGSTEGIQGHINALGHPPHNYVTVYAMVDDIQKYLAKAVELGGKVCVPATEVPQMGWFAWLQDPEGNILGLWKAMTPK